MATNRMSFGEHLKQFALSVDFIESGHYELVQQQIKNLWVISENGHLDFDNRGTDLWGEDGDTDLPPFYVATNAVPSRTAIVLITKNAKGYANGAFLIELSKVIRPSKVLRREMQLIADAVGLLHSTDVATHEQREGTTRAIDTLSDLVGKLELDTGPRPLMFVASSSRAPADITSAIEQVLAKFDDHVFVEPWHRMHQPEEYQANGDHKFRDNPNVLVEAGMLHMVTATDVTSGTGWIPIREKDSPAVPFDLGNQRMVLVRRNPDGEANIGAFKDDLTAKIVSLLETEPTHKRGTSATEE